MLLEGNISIATLEGNLEVSINILNAPLYVSNILLLTICPGKTLAYMYRKTNIRTAS